MRSTYAGLALVALAAAKPVPQSSSSCSGDYSGSFKIQVVQPSKAKRQSADTLTMTLSGGVLMDDEGRTGYIASNHQFQFDSPPQDGALQVDNFNVCGGFLAHGDDTTWDSCQSGDFSNLYDDNSAAAGNPGQCEEVNIQVLGAGSSSAPASAPASSAPAASSAPPATQLSDGQPQAPTSAAAPVTQISDGQPQAATSAAAPVTQISDGQPQAPTSVAAPVTQISDGQPQAPTSAAAPVTQISDGQIQAPTSAPYPSGTGGAAMPTGTGVMPYPSSSVVPATGAASSFSIGSSVVGLVAAVAAFAMY